MSTTPAQQQRVLENTLIIANAGAVAARVVRKMIGGEELSSQVAGQKASAELLQQMAHRELSNIISAK